MNNNYPVWNYWPRIIVWLSLITTKLKVKPFVDEDLCSIFHKFIVKISLIVMWNIILDTWFYGDMMIDIFPAYLDTIQIRHIYFWFLHFIIKIHIQLNIRCNCHIRRILELLKGFLKVWQSPLPCWWG